LSEEQISTFITVIVTHLDLAKNKSQKFKDVREMLETDFKINSFILVGDGADPEEISKAIEN
jgi:succinyl-CoA synthetase alpha subunit